MTYFSDFDTSEYYYHDEYLRKSILNQANEMYLEPTLESVPDDLFHDLELPFFVEAKDNTWYPLSHDDLS